MSRLLLASTLAVLAVFFGHARPAVATEEPTESSPPTQSEEPPEPPAAPEVPPEQPVVPEKPVEKPEVVTKPAPAAAPTSCPKAPIPVYIEDWGRLAELTASDPEVAPIARFWAERHEGTSTVVATGAIIGTGAILLGTMNRLTTDSWTETSKWEVAGGAAVVLVSALTSWLFAPDHDDLLTVINHWNLRHTDRPLAP